jgi:predicted nucleic acid-binding protein
MRFQRVLLDTGPLVAIRNAADSQHQRCLETLREIESPLITTLPIITEAAWMLRRSTEVVGRMLRGAADGLFVLADLTAAELLAIDELRRQYADLSPQLADLTLVHVAAREKLDTVFTLDRRDFSVFRLPGKMQFRILPEEV